MHARHATLVCLTSSLFSVKISRLLMQTEGMGMLKKIGRRGHVQQLVRAVAANNQSVEVLSLSGLSVKKSQVTALAQALKNNTVVTSLDLSNKVPVVGRLCVSRLMSTLTYYRVLLTETISAFCAVP